MAKRCCANFACSLSQPPVGRLCGHGCDRKLLRSVAAAAFSANDGKKYRHAWLGNCCGATNQAATAGLANPCEEMALLPVILLLLSLFQGKIRLWNFYALFFLQYLWVVPVPPIETLLANQPVTKPVITVAWFRGRSCRRYAFRSFRSRRC